MNRRDALSLIAKAAEFLETRYRSSRTWIWIGPTLALDRPAELTAGLDTTRNDTTESNQARSATAEAKRAMRALSRAGPRLASETRLAFGREVLRAAQCHGGAGSLAAATEASCFGFAEVRLREFAPDPEAPRLIISRVAACGKRRQLAGDGDIALTGRACARDALVAIAMAELFVVRSAKAISVLNLRCLAVVDRLEQLGTRQSTRRLSGAVAASGHRLIRRRDEILAVHDEIVAVCQCSRT